jgi:hypothetical protein
MYRTFLLEDSLENNFISLRRFLFENVLLWRLAPPVLQNASLLPMFTTIMFCNTNPLLLFIRPRYIFRNYPFCYITMISSVILWLRTLQHKLISFNAFTNFNHSDLRVEGGNLAILTFSRLISTIYHFSVC